MEFTTDAVFPNREELMHYVKGIAAQRNIGLSIQDSRKGIGNVKGYVAICCSLSGEYRPNKVVKERDCNTKKIGCKFKLYAKERDDGLWTYKVKNGRHNHVFPTYPEGGSLGKLTEKEYMDVCDASQSSMRPGNILTKLRRQNEKNVSTQRHVENALVKFKMEEREGRSSLQQFMKLLGDNQYYYATRNSGDSDVVGDIFFSHPVSYKMLNAFPYVIIADSTYKTNCYGLALLQVMGFTCTEKNFTVAYAFLEREREDNFAWALGHVRALFQDGKLPDIVFSDRDLAFINAVERVFPESAHHLCRRHIEVNVRKQALTSSTNKQFSESYMHRFNHAISAPTEEEGNRRWLRMEEQYEGYPDLLNYTKST